MRYEVWKCIINMFILERWLLYGVTLAKVRTLSKNSILCCRTFCRSHTETEWVREGERENVCVGRMFVLRLRSCVFGAWCWGSMMIVSMSVGEEFIHFIFCSILQSSDWIVDSYRYNLCWNRIQNESESVTLADAFAWLNLPCFSEI